MASQLIPSEYRCANPNAGLLPALAKSGLALLLACCLVTLASAQTTNLPLTHLTTRQGLSHNFINCIVSDRSGYVWFGTRDGLTRYDGSRCRVFRHIQGDSSSLPHNSVHYLSLDPQGRLWVSTAQGLARFDAARQQFVPVRRWLPETPSPDDHWSAFALDSAGYGWAVARNRLIRFDFNTQENQSWPYPGVGNVIKQAFIDSKQRVWLIADQYLYRFDRQNGLFDAKFGGTPDYKTIFPPMQLAEDRSGQLWLGTWGGGFYRYNEKTARFDDFPDGPYSPSAFALEELPDGAGTRFWCGTVGNSGLYLFTPQDDRHLEFAKNPEEQYSHNQCRAHCIYRDPATGIVWIGTEEGVEKYDPNEFKFDRRWFPPTDYAGYTAFMLQDMADADLFYLGVYGKGFFSWRRSTDRFEKLDARLPNTEIFGADRDAQGRIWMALQGSLMAYDPRTRQFRYYSPKFSRKKIANKLLSVCVAHDGRVWFGPNHEPALGWLDPASGRMGWAPLPENARDTLRGVRIYRLAEDARGRILATNDHSGFFRYDPATDRIEHLQPLGPQTPPSSDLTLDRAGQLFLAMGEMLLVLDSTDRIVRRLDPTNGLPVSRLYALFRDTAGYLWMNTINGICRYQPTTGAAELFDVADGLFNNYMENFFYEIPSTRELFLGYNERFHLANPYRLPASRTPPGLALSEVTVLNKPRYWQPGETLVLQPGENVLSFDFSIIHFTRPEKNRLVYRLEGFAPEWTETAEHLLTYTNLDPGHYTLVARARNADGMWSEQELRIPIRVVPPFYRTAWFRMLVIGLIAGVVWGLGRYRRQQRRHLSAIRRRIARDLHDDIGSGLSSIRFFSEVVKQQVGDTHPAAAPLLERMSEGATALGDNMRDIVWAISGKEDRLENLTARIYAFGLRICEGKGLAFQARFPDPLPDKRLRPDQLRNIYLIVKEALNNAAKYAGASEIGVDLRIARQHMTWTVTDNGIGFDPTSAEAGNGLENMRQRAAELRGRLEIRSAPGAGTRIVLHAEL